MHTGVSIGQPERKRQLGRPRHRWTYNIKMDFKAIEWEGMDWVLLAQNRNKW